MPFFSRGPALKQLSILFALHAAETEITEAQLFACVYSCCPMSWFEFCEELPDLLKEGYGMNVDELRIYSICCFLFSAPFL